MTLRTVQVGSPLPQEATDVLLRLYEVVKKCTRWGEHGETILGLKNSKIRGNTLFLRYIGTNKFLAINWSDLRLFLADYDLNEIKDGLKEIDLDDIEAIIIQLERQVRNISPVEL